MHFVSRAGARAAAGSAARKSILACLLAAFGALAALLPSQAAAAWSGPKEVSDATTRQASALDVDANPLGDFVLGWEYGTGDDVATVVEPVGGAPGAAQKFTGDYSSPTVGVGGNHVGAVAFASTLGANNYGIFAAAKPGGSNSFGTATEIQGPNDENATGHPILAVNGSGTAQLFHDVGNATFGFGHNIKGRILTAPGSNTWSAGSDFSAGQSFTHNRVAAAAPDGSTVLLWKSENGINFRTIETAVIENDGTASKGASLEASSGNDTGDLSNPSGIAVARMPDSSVVAAYATIPGHDGGIFEADFSKARAGGGTGDVGAVRRSDDEDGSNPDIATDAAGNTLLTWYDPSDGGADPKAIRARFRPAGGSFGATETIASGDVTGDYDMAMDGAGNAQVVFQTGSGDQIKATTRSQGVAGSWSAPELLSDGQSGVGSPRVATGRDYEAFAAWTADLGDGQHERVYRAELPQPACADGVDNDSDGKTDYPADPGCSGPTDNNETDPAPPAACADGVDNDSDGKTDYPADPGCSGPNDNDETDPAPAAKQCSDGVDNDSDGKTDYPADPGCSSPSDDSEADGGGGDNTVSGVDVDVKKKQAFKGRTLKIKSRVASQSEKVTAVSTGSITIKKGKHHKRGKHHRKGRHKRASAAGSGGRIRLTRVSKSVAAGKATVLRQKVAGPKKKVSKKQRQIKKALHKGDKVRAQVTIKLKDEAGNARRVKRVVRIK